MVFDIMTDVHLLGCIMWSCTLGCDRTFLTREDQERHLGTHNEDEVIYFDLVGEYPAILFCLETRSDILSR